MKRMKCAYLTLVACLCLLNVAVPSVKADQWPGYSAFFAIVDGIANSIGRDEIEFRHLVKSTSWWTTTYKLETWATYNRSTLCTMLTNKHNVHNAGMVGSIAHSACMYALSNGASYSAADWSAWSDRHCGTWYNDDGFTFPDNAQWFPATTDPANSAHLRQDVTFITRPTSCTNNCQDGWNGSGGSRNYIWGWDPKEDERSHQGYQGSTLGCPLNPAHVGGADCIIWATGEEAFLECVKNGVRTSAGFWGYGHWNLQALYSTC